LTVLIDMVPVKDEYSIDEVIDMLLAIQCEIEAKIESGKTPPYAYIDVKLLEKSIEFLEEHRDDPQAVDKLIEKLEKKELLGEVNT